MAKLAMKRIYICGLREERKGVMESLQRRGVMEIHNFVKEDDVFKKTPMPISGSEFERDIRNAETALSVLNEYDEEKSGLLSSFKGREIMETKDYDDFSGKFKSVEKVIDRILALYKNIAEDRSEITRAAQQIDMLAPWKGFDIPLDTNGTKSTAIFIGSVPGDHDLNALYEKIKMSDALNKGGKEAKAENDEKSEKETGTENGGKAEKEVPVDIELVSHDKNQTCFMLVCGKQDEDAVGAALRSIGFSYPSVSVKKTPEEQQQDLTNKIGRLSGDIVNCEEEILSYAKDRADIKFFADYQSIRAEKYAVTNGLPQSEHTFVVTGFIPEIYIEQVKKDLEPYCVSIDIYDTRRKDKVPVVLKNNAFSSSVQGVVESYALPTENEIDPTFLISLFYFIFFGFMLADAAIGLLLTVACGILLLKNKNMETGLKNMVKLIMFGGISAIFFGVLFGSYFGDLITSVSGNFFGHEIVVKPLWLDMTSNPMTVLTLALVMGLVHIFTGMGVAAYQYIKQKDIMALLFKVIIWYIILIGLIIKCLSMQMIMDILLNGREPILSADIGNIGLYVAGVGAVVVIFMGEYEVKSWPKRIIKGAYSVYGITSYLSDVLSYSRLLALGLATGVISSVANMIGTMFGNGIGGIILFIFVFLVINAINIGINTLGAYVHTNRLQYVEFFSRFYEGGGKPFEPYSIKTKYYKFKEN